MESKKKKVSTSATAVKRPRKAKTTAQPEIINGPINTKIAPPAVRKTQKKKKPGRQSKITLILSIVQVAVLVVQLYLLSQQNKFSRLQNGGGGFTSNVVDRNGVNETADRNELRRAIWDVLNSYPESGIEYLKKLSLREKVAWAQKVGAALDSQIKNPLLSKDKESLKYWRCALSSAKISHDLLLRNSDSTAQLVFENATISIFKSITSVSLKLLLNSGEVTAADNVRGHSVVPGD
jgi:hypothetical protein